MIEDDVRRVAADLSALKAVLTTGLARIEARLPPLLGDWMRVQELTGWSQSTIARRTKSGEIRSIGIGRKRLYDLSQFAPAGAEEIAALAAEARR